jgi:hypothetical protein
MDGLPGWEVVRQQAPGTATTEHIEDSVKDFARRVKPRPTNSFGDGEMGFYDCTASFSAA